MANDKKDIPCINCITLAACKGLYTSTFNKNSPYMSRNRSLTKARKEIETKCCLIKSYLHKLGKKGSYDHDRIVIFHKFMQNRPLNRILEKIEKDK